jgi:hypothetical protein
VAALLGTRRVVLPNSVLNFTHCRIVLIVQPIFPFSGNLYLSLAKGICFFGKRYMFSTSICRVIMRWGVYSSEQRQLFRCL